MKNFQILIVFIFSILSQTANANFDYQYGDTLTVWATSGLNMREGPGTDFPKLKKLEYGTQVQVIDNYIQSTPLDLKVFKRNKKTDAFTMHGFWVRVKIGRQEGYVFDGYLSRLPVLYLQDGVCERLLNYAQREFTLINEQKVSIDLDTYTLIYNFENNIKFERAVKKSPKITLTIPNISRNESFIFFNIFLNWKYWSNNEDRKFYDSKYKIITNSRNEIKASISESECEYHFEYKNGTAVISRSCSC